MRALKLIIPSFLLGAVFGAAFWYLASPLWIDVEVNETIATSGTQTIAVGTLRDADAAHKGTGDVRVVTRADGGFELQLTDFEVTNGPDLEVWLSAHPDPQTSADVKEAAFLSLGQLKGNIGNQAYPIPADADLAAYGSAVIWCEQFGVLFSPAALSPPS
ncbi:MAG: DM13 domain-containing protein [Pseudomonadota bacterium]